MSMEIDNRIVNMIFNNQQFEEGVSETTESLDKLKKSLDFDGVKDAAKGVDLSGIADSIEGLTSKFSAFKQFGIRIIQEFASDVYRTTKNLVNDAVVKPIKDGFDEYQLKMGSVQTILNSAVNKSGAKVSLEEVNYQLEELNKYADKTIYSFRDMTSNIGKFTNSGVALEDAVAAIQGVSNVAALSGANANEASRAMYNFAQALSAGYVKLIDWKSIENANMATVEFKQQLIDTAVALGTLEKRADGTYKVLSGGGFFEGKGKEKIEKYISATQNFNDSLSKAWMTSEVLTTTLAKYSDETTDLGKRAFAAATEVKTLSQAWDTLREAAGSSWAQTFEIIFGDFNEGKALWTRLEQDLETIFVKGSERRNEFIQSWVDLGGRGSLFDTTEENLGALWNLLDVVKILINTVKTAFTDVFGSPSAQMLANLTDRFQKFTEKLTTNIRLFRTIGSLFRGFFSAVALVGDVFKAVIGPMNHFFEAAIRSKDTFYRDISSIGDTITRFREKLLESGFFDSLSDKFAQIYNILGRHVYMIRNILRTLTIFLSGSHKQIDTFGSHIFTTSSKFIQIANVVRSVIRELIASIAGVIAVILGKDAPVYSEIWITNILDKFEDSIYNIYEKIKNADVIGKIKEFWAAIGGEGFKEKIIEFWGTVKEAFSGITSRLPSLEKLKELLSAIFGFLKNAAKAILPSLTDFGSFVLNLVDKLVDGLTVLFKALGEGLSTGSLAESINGVFKVGIGYSFFKSVDGLSDLIKSLSGAFEEGGSVHELISQLTKTLKAMETEVDAKALKNIAISVGVLAVSLLLLAGIDASKLTAASVALSLLMKSFVSLMTSKLGGIESAKSLMQTAASLTVLSAAIFILATSLKKIGEMNIKDIGKGLAVVSVLMAELLYSVTLLSNKEFKATRSLDRLVKDISKIAKTMVMFALAMKLIATISWPDIIKGLFVISTLLVELTAMSIVLSKVSKDFGVAKIGGDMMALALAMILFASAVKILGSMDINSLGVGLAAFSGILVVTYMVALAFSELDSKKLLAASGALVIFGMAMLEISLAFKLLSTMDMNSMLVGLVALAGSLTAVTLLLEVLTKMDTKDLLLTASAVMTMSEAILVFSVAMALLGHMNIVQLSAGFVAIVLALAAFAIAAKVLKPIYDDMERLAKTFLLFGAAAALFGVGLALVSVSLATFGGSLVIAVAAIIEAVKLLITAIPDIAIALADSLSAAFDAIWNIIATLIKILVTAFIDSLPTIIDVILQAIKLILRAIADNIDAIVIAILEIIEGILSGLAQGIPGIVTSLFKMLHEIIVAFIDAIKELGSGEIIGAIVGAIVVFKFLPELIVAIVAITATALIATAALPIIGENLSSFMTNLQPFLDGIKNVGTETLNGAKVLAEAILVLTVSSILEGIANFILGKSSFESFGKELAAFGPYLKKYNDSIKGINNTAITASAEAVKTMADMANTLPNSGGIVSWFTGDNTLADFGEMLAEFGPYFAKYAQSVNGIDPLSIMASATAAKSLAEMANTLPNSGGIISWITGDNTLADFGKMLSDFGPYLKSYSDSVAGLNVPAIAASVTGATYLVSLANAIKLIDVDSKNGPISHFGEQVQKMGNSIYSYALFMEAVNWDSFARSVLEINKLADLSDRLEVLDTSELSTFAQNISKMATNGINLLLRVFTNAYTTIYNATIVLSKKAVSGINSVTPQFATAGANLMQGMINGLNSRAQSVYNTAQAIANRAAQVVRNALQIHSPSRVFEQIGMYVDLGFAKGLTDYADTIESSADIVGRSTMDAMAEAVQNAVNNIDSNPDFSPTITPVLDMSYVDEGLGRLGDSFNGSRLRASGFYRTSFDLAGSIADSNRTNQNGGVLSMMTQMMDQFAALSEAVENMQIVMDSGVVVGAIAPKMDAALGQRIVYKGRGH